MVDPHLQQRFARRCADAAFGYSAASTAAYAAFADQVLNFWTNMLQPPRRDVEVWSWPAPAPRSAVPAFPAMPFAQMPFAPFAWPMATPAPAPPALPTNPWEAMTAFTNAMTSAMSGASMGTSMISAPAVNPFGNPMMGPMANPMMAWLAMFPFSAPPSAWPMAFMLMSSGVPHSVAWPTAEANAAVMDAADAATQSIKQVMASYRTDGGHGTASSAAWPHESMLTLAALMPLNISTMLAALRGG